jgi:predicted GTPase
MSEIITCQKCNQKLRIPTNRESIEITCPSCKTIQNLSSNTMNDDLSAIKDKATLEKILSRIRATKVNVLLIGATGSGKSSTISALFEDYGNGRKSSAKVGQTSRPETMDVSAHEMDNLVIWDTPGLGDSTKQDEEHQQKIVELLRRKDENGQPLIDLIFLVLDAGSRDFKTAYSLIGEVVLPNIHKDDHHRLLIGLNQADLALKGQYWNKTENKPEQKLIDRLEEQVRTVKERIKSETGLDVDPIYYSAGFKDEDQAQQPYNLQKLLSFILDCLPAKKRAAMGEHINSNKDNFKSNDNKEDYDKKVENSIWSSFKIFANEVIDEGLDKIKNAASDILDKTKDVLTDPKIATAAATFLFSLYNEYKSSKTKGK